MSDNSGHLAANVRLMAAAPSMYDALWAIANMQIKKETDKGEVLALCMAIARIELEKCSGAIAAMSKRGAPMGEDNGR